VESETPLAYVVRRSVLDEHLLRLAEAAGAEVLEGTEVVSWGQDAGGVWVVVRSLVSERPQPSLVRTLGARFLIGADGASSTVARGLGRGRETEPRGPGRKWAGPRALCLGGFIPLPPREALEATRDNLDFHFGLLAGGYGWVFPARSGLAVGVGALYRPAGSERTRPGPNCSPEGPARARLREALSRMLCHCGHPHSGPAEMWRVPLGGWRRPHGAGRVLLAGDAAGTAEPLTGEGIGPAVRSAELAARTVIRWARAGTRKARAGPSDSAGRVRMAAVLGAPAAGDIPGSEDALGAAGAGAVGDAASAYADGLWSAHLAPQRARLWSVRLASLLPPGGQAHLFRRSVFERFAGVMRANGPQ